MRCTDADTARLLEALAGSDVFAEYCRARGIGHVPPATQRIGEAELRAWHEALAALSPERQTRIELELAQVADLSHRDAVHHLIDACGRKGLPSELVAGEPAQALWFLLHRPEVFSEVHFHEEVSEISSWRNAAAPAGLDVPDHEAARREFEAELRTIVARHDGAGRFCASRSYRLTEPDCHVFVGYVSDRLRFLEAFSDSGEHQRHRIRPATEILFAYYPSDGTVLLKSRHRRRQTVLDLFRGFAHAVLGASIDPASLDLRFRLDRLLERFDPPLPRGVAQVRVRALELAYRGAAGRRRVRLETTAGDGAFAIFDLLRDHGGPAERRGQLQVVQADLQVRLDTRGRSRSQMVRLWPNRSSLNQTPTSELLRKCLRSWQLLDAPQP